MILGDVLISVAMFVPYEVLFPITMIFLNFNTYETYLSSTEVAWAAI